MCSERYIKVKLVLLTTGGSACGQVCACACVCVGSSVWQTPGYIEGPGDVPWAPASPSEGSPLHNRPAWDLVRIRPSPAWYKGKPVLATVGRWRPRRQPAGANSDWNTGTEGSGIPQGAGQSAHVGQLKDLFYTDDKGYKHEYRNIKPLVFGSRPFRG